MEQWKVFFEYDTHHPAHHVIYQVSNLGRIRNLTTGYIYKQKIAPRANYVTITITHFDGAKRINNSWCLHRLVAENFIPNPENKPCVDHIDGDRMNNAASNLRWVTHKENNNNPITKQRLIDSIGDRSGKNNPNYKHGRYCQQQIK